MVERSVPSISVAVARGDQILWEESFGWADRERKIPADPNTPYSIASITKPMTATALMTLVRAGKIDLDRPINDYLGATKLRARLGDAREATVRRVANHSAGLPEHYQFFYKDEPWRPPSIDETILRFGNLFTPPDEAFRYSNLGYGLLSTIIARASGRSYARYMRDEVFLKLGMTHTTVSGTAVRRKAPRLPAMEMTVCPLLLTSSIMTERQPYSQVPATWSASACSITSHTPLVKSKYFGLDGQGNAKPHHA